MRVGVESWPSLLTVAAPRRSSRDASAGAAIVGVGSTGGSGTVGGATSSGAVAAGARSGGGQRWRGHVCGEVGHRLEHRRFEQLRHEVGRAAGPSTGAPGHHRRDHGHDGRERRDDG